MKKYALIFTLLLSTVMAQTVLDPNCYMEADKYGFVELQATAGYEANHYLYCYETDVSVIISENGDLVAQHQLNKYIDCKFSKFVKLPIGVYTATFRASYEDYEDQVSRCIFSVAASSEPSIVVYAPAENSKVRVNNSILIEAVALSEGSNIIGGAMTAKLANSTHEYAQVELGQDTLGAFKKQMRFEAPVGKYSLVFEYDDGTWQVSESVDVEVVTGSTDPDDIEIGSKLSVLYPQSGAEFDANESIPLTIEFEDENGMIINSADVTATIYLDSEEIDQISFLQQRYYYKKEYTFEEPGYYTIIFNGEKGDRTSSKTITLTIGGVEDISQSMNFTVSILIPGSDVYAINSRILARARVLKQNEPVSDAIVTLFMEDMEEQMQYEGFGEYTLEIGPFNQGNYIIKIVAESNGLIAEDAILFQTSEHILEIIPRVPEQSDLIELEEGDPIEVKVLVKDEANDDMAGVLVVAEILEPEGRKISMQLFQNQDTALYESIFYPNVEGTYQLSFNATKPGYIGDLKDITFNVEFEGEESVSVQMNLETLLTIIVAIIVAILVIALLRGAL